MSDLSYAAHGLDWLVTEFVSTVPGAAHAVVVSSDGLPLSVSSGFPAEHADQLATIAAGLVSLARGGARLLDGGTVVQTLVEMDQGLMLVMAIDDGASLTVLAAPECDLELVAYQMTLLVDRAGQVLTPAVREHVRAGRAQSTDRA